MKGEGKTVVMKSKMKCVGMVGLVLSSISISLHFLLAWFTEEGVSDYSSSSITLFSWRPNFEEMNGIPKPQNMLHRRLWGAAKPFKTLQPDANPRGFYSEPQSKSNGYMFVRIQGGFHEIRNALCDVVAVARLLNATLVIPEIQSTTSKKGISSEFKSFAYLYNEEHFMLSLSKDVKVVKTLPKNLKGARKKKEIPSFKVPFSATPFFYLHHVLPVLKKHSVAELVVPDGGCLQAVLPPEYQEHQRLRCRVSFHNLQFRHAVQELATKILHRLRAHGRPFIAYDPGMTRDALAYYGCAELFQDVHNELIQHKRSWMIKRRMINEKLSVNSREQRLNGLCPLMPEEVGILLRAYGYSWDTIIYLSGGEVFGGQRTLIPLHAMFENVVDRTSLSTGWELTRIYGREMKLSDKFPRSPTSVVQEIKLEKWKNGGPRPRPLPPPPARPKYPYNIEGWWGWVAESDNEPESTIMELRTNAHKLLWEAIDYIVAVESDIFIPGFDRDGKGHPNFASLVMGHRIFKSPSMKTFRSDRKEIVQLLEANSEHLYQANRSWVMSVRRSLRKSLLERVVESLKSSKKLSFLSHPVPECSCIRQDLSLNSSNSDISKAFKAVIGDARECPLWMKGEGTSNGESDDDLEEDVSSSSGLFLGSNGRSEDCGIGEANKEENPMEDQEEFEGGE